jgi:predicted amidohydrolase YtcJ
MGTLLRLGTRLSFGSDWPVSSHEPLLGIQTATTRRTLSGSEPWIPGERLAVEDALRAQTSGVAYQAFAEHRWGTLAEGMEADLVWLGGDPRTADPGDIHRIPVLGTWLAGSPTYATVPSGR